MTRHLEPRMDELTGILKEGMMGCQMSEGKTDGMTEGVNDRLSDGLIEEISEGVPEEMEEGTTHGAFESVHEG